MFPFVYVSTYRVVICAICRFACVANEVGTHLRTRHRDISTIERQIIIKAVQQTPNIIRNQAELREFQLPSPTSEPISFLELPRSDGLKCLMCPYISRHVQKIQAHCRVAHGWKNERKRGRLTATDSLRSCKVPWTTGVKCQRFFRSRAASGWFEVGRSAQNNDLFGQEFDCSPLRTTFRWQPSSQLRPRDITGPESFIERQENPSVAMEGRQSSTATDLTVIGSFLNNTIADSVYYDIWGQGYEDLGNIDQTSLLPPDYLSGQEIQLW